MSRFVTRKWIEVNDLSKTNIMLTKNISSKTIMLRSDLCDYSDTYFVVDRRTNVRVTANTDANQKDAAFKKTTIGSCITKINNTLIH